MFKIQYGLLESLIFYNFINKKPMISASKKIIGLFVSCTILVSLNCNNTKQVLNDTEVLNRPTHTIVLKDWKIMNEANKDLWSVIDNIAIGGDGIQKIPRNTYLCSTNTYDDFEFRALFRLSGDHDLGLINSGIQYRSFLESGKIIGYQADIGKGYWGDIYDEHRRGKLSSGDLSILKSILKEDGWNSYIIRCIGNHHELYINGVKTNDYIETNPNIPKKGIFAIQLHSGGNAKIELKNVTITEF